MVTYWVFYGFCSQLLYCFQTEQDMCSYYHFTSHFDVCIFAAGRQVQEVAKYSERVERSLTGIPYMEDRAIKRHKMKEVTQFPLYVNYVFDWTELLYL